MTDHLDDAEFAAALAGDEPAGDVAEHLADCVCCRRQLAAMRGWIAERRDRMAEDAPDWAHQREGVVERLNGVDRARPRRRWLRPALAAAAVVAIVAGVALLQQRGDDPGRDLAVEEILAETEALLADDSIPGFEVIDPGFEELREPSSNGMS
jgi:anti-sigma factor RsiW